MIDTVIFDIGNVLTEFRWNSWIRELLGSEETVRRVEAAMFAKSPRGISWWDELDLGEMSDDEIMSGFIKNDPEAEDAIRMTYSRVGDCMFRCAYAVPWIESVKARGIRALYLSNYSAHLIRSNPGVLDFLTVLDGGVFSFIARSLKPDQAIYARICSEYGLTPGNCVFIDDLERNIEGARRFGMKGIRFISLEQAEADLEALLSA